MGQFNNVAGVAGAQQHLFNKRFAAVRYGAVCRTITFQRGVTGAGSYSGPFVGISSSQKPGAMSAHGMTSQVNMLRVWFKFFFGEFQHFQGIKPAPVFPVKSARTPVRSCYQVTPVFWFIGPGLPDRFNARSMHRKKQSAPRSTRRPLWCYCIILQASIYMTDKCIAVFIGGLYSVYNYFFLVNGFPFIQ